MLIVQLKRTLFCDPNAAANIRHLAMGIPINKAYRVSKAVAGVGRKPSLAAPAEVMGVFT
ncbi:hypothetical protein [Pleurocapsa sp. PCC 7327]|uniref:hypothetical protein n=1 Tax=Pleurocapsa sp. PCC 7327 TaxID=118163 RepID=UPI00118699BD|nr:hypothetical protein [Pleurocapsa sp. PCC 7327]